MVYRILVAGWVRSACQFDLIEVECERNGNTIKLLLLDGKVNFFK